MSDAQETQKTPLSGRELGLIAAAMLAVIYAFFAFWHQPRSREMENIQKQLVQDRKKLESDLAIVQSLTSQSNPDGEEEKPRDSAEVRMDQIREMNSNFANIVRELSGGDQPDLFQIKTLAAGAQEKFADYTKVRFELEIEAPFLSVGQFLEKLENSDLLTEVTQIEVSRVEREMRRCTIKLGLFSYAARQ